ncbi:MAG TPA: porin, partial [Bacteroidota bacterium]|nr:porin [Bacteroidota bacterium]
ALKKIKISGYIQSQFQVADSDGIASVAGGNFPTGVHSRFAVRRGRVKFNYDNDLTQYVLQIDVTQGGVGIKDAYISIKEPWLRTFSLTSGIFDRPFGFEISYSSSNREAPERSRMYQVLFPGERELGVKIEATPEKGPLSIFNFKGGFFNGVLNTANENDNNKDFIGRLGTALQFDEAGLAIDAGASIYSGKVRSNSTQSWAVSGTQFIRDTTAFGKYFDRTYTGVDLQLNYDLPVIGGMSLRGEYISGKQPGTGSSNSFYNNGWISSTPAVNTPVYNRNFSGYYVNYVQNIGLSNQFVVKYDVFDPNTDIEGTGIGAAGTNFSAADVKYSTLGIGWVYHWDANVKFTVYYDMVKNEKVNASATGSLAAFRDDLKDNVLTVRMQYKF